ncbi:hypothetical protein EIP86_006586 [Pleurotus ostreatoroseus]|nr:hypothetical protein EIP86_006586 [Pleurotus ostreatoroseus]
MTFEKPTGLASESPVQGALIVILTGSPAQLQSFEDSAPESLEFERLKEHFEPFLRASSSTSGSTPSHSHHAHTNPITAAASSALNRDIPGVAKYTPLVRSRSGRDRGAGRNEIPSYKARSEISNAGLMIGGGGDTDVEFMRGLETESEVASLEQRWTNSWTVSIRTNLTPFSDLKPLRIPLRSKKSKRCPQCRHILIKPEQKAQSVRYKIKLVAANYLPAIAVGLPHAQAALELLRRPAVQGKAAVMTDRDESMVGAMHAGKTYAFHLAFTNPLYDPIQVRLHVQRAFPPGAGTSAPSAAVGEASAEAGTSDKPQMQTQTRRPPFAVSLPSAAFPIAAFAEAWEYEDDEEMFVDEDDDFDGRRDQGRGRTRTVGVLERRANVTVIGGEVVIGKEARGNVKFNMLVSYTYRSDDAEAGDEPTTPSRTNKQPEMKTFSFYTVINLGPIIAREESRADMMEL